MDINGFINIEIGLQSIKDRLLEILKRSGNENYELLASVIIGDLSYTEKGLEHLFNAFSGIEEKIDFMPGDEAKVKYVNLYTWNFNAEDNKSKGLVDSDGIVKVKILEINNHKRDNVKISYNIIKTGATEMTVYEQPINSKHLFRDNNCTIRNNISNLL